MSIQIEVSIYGPCIMRALLGDAEELAYAVRELADQLSPANGGDARAKAYDLGTELASYLPSESAQRAAEVLAVIATALSDAA